MNIEADAPLEGTPLIRPSTTDHPLYDAVVEACRTVYDPEIPVNIFDLGLVYTITVDEGNKVIVDMSLTSPGCPAGPQIMHDVERTIQAMPGVGKVVINLVWEPFWTPDRIEPKVRAYMGI